MLNSVIASAVVTMIATVSLASGEVFSETVPSNEVSVFRCADLSGAYRVDLGSCRGAAISQSFSVRLEFNGQGPFYLKQNDEVVLTQRTCRALEISKRSQADAMNSNLPSVLARSSLIGGWTQEFGHALDSVQLTKTGVAFLTLNDAERECPKDPHSQIPLFRASICGASDGPQCQNEIQLGHACRQVARLRATRLEKIEGGDVKLSYWVSSALPLDKNKSELIELGSRELRAVGHCVFKRVK